MKKRKIIAANWKMAPVEEKKALQLFTGVKRTAIKLKNVDTIICPPFVYVKNIAKRVPRKRLFAGAQNSFWKDEGAYTGEISPTMLERMGVSYVILGHSERRALGETDEMVSQKINMAVKAELSVILCVGEKERDEHGSYVKDIESQVKGSLAGVPRRALDNIIIAYEPVWAIGARALRAATPGDVIEVSILLRKILTALYGNDAGRAFKILYGGSVDAKNCGSFMNEGGADGLLVGRASLDVRQFSEILKVAEQSAMSKKVKVRK